MRWRHRVDFRIERKPYIQRNGIGNYVEAAETIGYIQEPRIGSDWYADDIESETLEELMVMAALNRRERA